MVPAPVQCRNSIHRRTCTGDIHLASAEWSTITIIGPCFYLQPSRVRDSVDRLARGARASLSRLESVVLPRGLRTIGLALHRNYSSSCHRRPLPKCRHTLNALTNRSAIGGVSLLPRDHTQICVCHVTPFCMFFFRLALDGFRECSIAES